MQYKKHCENCRELFIAKRRDKRFCCNKCQRQTWARTPSAKALQKRYRRKQKIVFFEMYGKVCNCCGEDNVLFLTLDHIQGRINKYKDGGGGTKEYTLAISLYRPDLFQALCMNCNAARFWYGECPHQTGASVIDDGKEQAQKQRGPSS